MTLETFELRSILQTSRSLRYAFIVDPASHEIFNQLSDILEFSLKMWGGRLNAIIPLIEGEISQDWWQILKICDPDKIIACTALNSKIIKKIYRDICPAEITCPNDRDSILAPRQCPVSIFEIPRYQEKNLFNGKSNKYYCIKHNGDKRNEKHKFIEVNFGCYTPVLKVTESFKNINSKEILLSDEFDIKSFITEISCHHDENFVFPIDICGIYAPKHYNTAHVSSALQIIIGNSPLDLIYFWNRHIYTNGQNGRDTIWIPPELLDDEETTDAIGKWISSQLLW